LKTQPDLIPEGLPDHLPEGEQLLWQGRPNWKRLAINAFHIRKVASYFVLLIVGQGVWKLLNGASFAEAFHAVPTLAGLCFAACAILLGFAYLSARTTHYTLTSKRALMKVGIALPVIVNLPLRQIDGVSFAYTGKGCGTICFKPGGKTRLAYLLLWPHAKPWNVTKTQPAFRDIADVDAVASRLALAMGGQMPVADTAYEMPQGQLIAAE
jgi:Bacterial PH domain